MLEPARQSACEARPFGGLYNANGCREKSMPRADADVQGAISPDR